MKGGTTLSGTLQTTEFIELDKEGENGISIPGPDLPLPFFRHCFLALTESTYMIIGDFFTQHLTAIGYKRDTNHTELEEPILDYAFFLTKYSNLS